MFEALHELYTRTITVSDMGFFVLNYPLVASMSHGASPELRALVVPHNLLFPRYSRPALIDRRVISGWVSVPTNWNI